MSARRQPVARPLRSPARRLRAFAGVGLLVGALGCAREAATWSAASRARAAVYERTLEAIPAPAEDSGELRVQLAFGDTADLDLYVTDPLEETLYFARRSTRSGGHLEADRVCSDDAPRVERVVYPVALPGRYRIGVDYHSACSDGGDREAFALQVDYAGARETRRREIDPRHFEIIVWEFEIRPPAEVGKTSEGAR